MRETVYKKMYTTLFNAVTDALERMEDEDFLAAQELLRRAQQAGRSSSWRKGKRKDKNGNVGRPPPGRDRRGTKIFFAALAWERAKNRAGRG